MIYVPTLEELQIFCEKKRTVEDSYRYKTFVIPGGWVECQEYCLDALMSFDADINKWSVGDKFFAAGLMAEVDPGFIGEGPNNYILDDEIIEIRRSDEDWFFRVGIWTAACKSEYEAKSLMFRLVLCWIRQQEDKRLEVMGVE